MTPAELADSLEQHVTLMGESGYTNQFFLDPPEAALLAAALRLAEAVDDATDITSTTIGEVIPAPMRSALAAYRSARQRLATNAP